MDPITVNKDDLSKRIAENRDQHVKIFEEAVEGYKKRAVELLEEHIERIKKGKLEKVMVHLPMPSNHVRDYDRVLEMLAMHQEDTIEIGEHDFMSYVMDDWAWKQEFLTSSSAYSVTAAASLGS